MTAGSQAKRRESRSRLPGGDLKRRLMPQAGLPLIRQVSRTSDLRLFLSAAGPSVTPVRRDLKARGKPGEQGQDDRHETGDLQAEAAGPTQDAA